MRTMRLIGITTNRTGITISRNGIPTNWVAINIRRDFITTNRIGRNISEIGINGNGGCITINRTSTTIIVERICMSTKLISIVMVTLI